MPVDTAAEARMVVAGRVADPTTQEVTPAELEALRPLLDALDLLPRPETPDEAEAESGPDTTNPVKEPIANPAKEPAAVRDECGTRNGYQQHVQLGEEACEDCKAANRIYAYAWYQRNRANRRELAPCGTEAAYQRHRRRREECRECKDANARAGREKRARQSARRARDRATA
ncbi:hypothetical protein [Nocardiopsis sp. FR26]|uniref:hypothetical protein n=1 Tax=Nocardiopsis sp. FR26 TaxID=2605987 RepID=UPI0013570D02|nr:hypothetical protein [Nocardiopsis sp. FR26]